VSTRCLDLKDTHINVKPWNNVDNRDM
jgi:hypothetical protein